MAKSSSDLLKRGSKVVNLCDLQGVPRGTTGRVVISSGITWVRYWVDFDNGVYGVGDLDGRGFKASPDREGPAFDPDSGERVASDEKEQEARAYLATRFPALADAPLVGTRSCPYSLTEDTNFLIVPHLEHERVWLLGGGSGHGFKHGLALAEYVERLLNSEEEPSEAFALGARSPGGGLRAPWIER